MLLVSNPDETHGLNQKEESHENKRGLPRKRKGWNQNEWKGTKESNRSGYDVNTYIHVCICHNGNQFYIQLLYVNRKD